MFVAVLICCLSICSFAVSSKRLSSENIIQYAVVKYEVLSVYRWYWGMNGDHFFCLDPKGEIVPQVGYRSEGIGFDTLKNQELGAVPLYRLSSSAGGHFYTSSSTEHDSVVGSGWSAEGNIGYVFTSQVPGSLAIHRYYHSGLNKHFYTIHPENELLSGWNDEGVLGYGFDPHSKGDC